MSETPAARVYAQALFDAAPDQGETNLASLESLLEVSQSEPGLWQRFLDPRIPVQARKELIGAITGDATELRNLLWLLVDKHRLGELDSIVTSYRERVHAQTRQLEMTVTTAVELPAELATKLAERLSSQTGAEVQLLTQIDPAIIGGLVVQYGDLLVDSSIRGRLDGLRTALKRSTIQ